MNQLIKLQEQLRQAVLARNYIKINKLQSQIKAEQSRQERISLATMLPEISEEDKKKSLHLMHQVFIFADLLYGAALDFESHLRKQDKSIVIDICEQAKKAAKACRNITREVDNMNSKEMSEDYGNMCDNIQMMVMNEVYKHENKVFK